jgi:predicted lipid-binding transport protein (Tim44 family)
MEKKETESFSYTYSAKQREEIKAIRKKYEAPEENKMEQLRRLDASATKKATIRSMTVGIIGALIMGLGMSISMTDIGAVFGSFLSMLVGIVIGVLGIVLVCLAYPTYHRTLKAERERIAPEVLRLSDELMK